MSAEQKQPPVLVAAFADEADLAEAMRQLQDRKIGPDFVGAYLGEDPSDISGERSLYLLSVFAARRLHEELAAALKACSATQVGSVDSFRQAYGLVPHPGVLDYHDMRLPMGSEYPLTRLRRAKA